MSEETTPAPENIIPIATEAATAPVAEAPAAEPAAEQKPPQTIQELVASIDISEVTEHEIISDLIAGIQQLAIRGTIALGLLEKMKIASAEAETPAAEAETES